MVAGAQPRGLAHSDGDRRNVESAHSRLTAMQSRNNVYVSKPIYKACAAAAAAPGTELPKTSNFLIQCVARLDKLAGLPPAL
jgi:hypothetical protein